MESRCCHGVGDEHGRLRRFRLTAGQRHDMVAAWEFVDEAPLEARALIADKGYDSQELRAWLDDQGMTPVIPRWGADGQRPSEHTDLYRERNRIERAFNRLKDYRRFATRFDKLRTTFEATVALIATRIRCLI